MNIGKITQRQFNGAFEQIFNIANLYHTGAKVELESKGGKSARIAGELEDRIKSGKV